jgi:2',3'-cyclic-nucleotide 2'-phosphodiesterase
MRILFVADVFGPPGRRAVTERLPELRHELDVDFCVVNGENAADGVGLTAKLAAKLLAAGADVLTTGNHVWRHRDLVPVLESDPRVIRPANFGDAGIPGSGLAVGTARNGEAVAVVNLQGAIFMATPVHPFRVVDALVDEARAATPVVVVDFHGEATSEKVALARMLDGRVTAVIGTHTHVQTNDARVLPGGTAAITDAGMTGPHDSVIGVRAELAIQRMRTGMPVRFHPAEGDVRIEGVLVESDSAGRATRCEALRVPVAG